MPHHLIIHAREWINEILTIPIYYPARPKPRERARARRRLQSSLVLLCVVFCVCYRESAGSGALLLPADEVFPGRCGPSMDGEHTKPAHQCVGDVEVTPLETSDPGSAGCTWRVL